MKLFIFIVIAIAVVFITSCISRTYRQTEPFTDCVKQKTLKKYRQKKLHGLGVGIDGVGVGDMPTGINMYQRTTRDNNTLQTGPASTRTLLRKKRTGILSNVHCKLYFRAFPFIELYRLDDIDNKLYPIQNTEYKKVNNSIYQLIQVVPNQQMTESDREKAPEDLVKEGKYAVKVELTIPKVMEGDDIYIGLYHQEGENPLQYFGGTFQNGISRVYSSPSTLPCVGMYFGKEVSAQMEQPFISLQAKGCYDYDYESDQGVFTRYDASVQGLSACLDQMDDRKRFLGLSNTPANCFVSDQSITHAKTSNDKCSVLNGRRVGTLNGNTMFLYEMTNRNIELSVVGDTTLRTALMTQAGMDPSVTLVRPSDGTVGMTGIYLFRYTVQRPFETKRFCPNMNYAEFDRNGCSSRLTPQACINTVNDRYLPDASLCKTRINFGDDDNVYSAYKYRKEMDEKRRR